MSGWLSVRRLGPAVGDLLLDGLAGLGTCRCPAVSCDYWARRRAARREAARGLPAIARYLASAADAVR